MSNALTLEQVAALQDVRGIVHVPVWRVAGDDDLLEMVERFRAAVIAAGFEWDDITPEETRSWATSVYGGLFRRIEMRWMPNTECAVLRGGRQDGTHVHVSGAPTTTMRVAEISDLQVFNHDPDKALTELATETVDWKCAGWMPGNGWIYEEVKDG